MKYTREIVSGTHGGALLPQRAPGVVQCFPGAKSLVCIGLYENVSLWVISAR